MSFELSPNRVRTRQKHHGRGVSIFVTLISPLLAVMLSQYLNARRQCQTTFAPPVPCVAMRVPVVADTQVRAESPAVVSLSTITPDAWQAFVRQPQKQALAKKLMASAEGAKDDPAVQFAMLHRAKDVATEANDGQTAFAAIDAMAETFHADPDTLKMSVLAKLASAARQPTQHQSIAEQALKLGDQALGRKRFMVANQLGRLAIADARQSRDGELLAKAQGRLAEVAERVRAKGRASYALVRTPQ